MDYTILKTQNKQQREVNLSRIKTMWNDNRKRRITTSNNINQKETYFDNV